MQETVLGEVHDTAANEVTVGSVWPNAIGHTNAERHNAAQTISSCKFRAYLNVELILVVGLYPWSGLLSETTLSPLDYNDMQRARMEPECQIRPTVGRSKRQRLSTCLLPEGGLSMGRDTGLASMVRVDGYGM